MRKLKGQKGLSLVEVTIMLLVLMLLTSVLAPSIYDFVIDAQWVKVKEDCEAIGISVARLTRDVGPCLKLDGSDPCEMDNRVDILYSDGPAVDTGDLLGEGDDPYASGNMKGGTYNWADDNGGGATPYGDAMEDQFATNGPAYPTPADNYNYFPVGPLFGLGWRGGYLAAPIGPDPWGSRYLVNSVFLGVASDAATSADEGYATRWWERDVFCISPGPNRLYETFFGGCVAGAGGYYGTCRQSDDWTFIIQGSGR